MKRKRGEYPEGLQKELGTARDAELARKYGYSREFIRQLREKSNIPKFTSLIRSIELATMADLKQAFLPVEQRLYSINEAATYLGLSKRTLVRMLKNKEFKIIKTAGKFLLDKKDLDKWIEKKKSNGTGGFKIRFRE